MNKSDDNYISIVAHRGFTDDGKIIENTLEAFAAAIDIGADMVEFDLRCTQDRKIVVYHNKTIGGLTIGESDYDDLEKAASNLGFHLPLFKEALSICNGRIFMDIEVKEEGFEKEMLRILSVYSSEENYWIKSFKDNVIYRVKKLNPYIKTGLLIGYKKANLKRRFNEVFPERRLRMCRADFVSPSNRLIHLLFLERMKAAGYPVFIWTVNNESAMRRFFSYGEYFGLVNGVITDCTDKAIVIRNKYLDLTNN